MKRLPTSIVAIALGLSAIGILYVRSASWDPTAGAYGDLWRTQALWLAIALSGFTIVALMPYAWLERHAYVFYGVALLLLAGLPVVGELSNGARSWYRFGPVRLQPAELAKAALVLGWARQLGRARSTGRLRGLLPPLALLAPVFLMIAAQPDLGTAVVLLPTLLAMLVAAGARLRHLAAGIGGSVVALGAAAACGLLRQHQLDRLASFVNPDKDPLGKGFQAIQARIATGAGGLFGQGYGQGSQTQLHQLPDSHTDFIFSVVCEEGGFVMGALVLGLYLALYACALGVALRQRAPGARVAAVGAASAIGAQAAINVAMTLGLFPVTGITLPFLSYGGSSLVASFALLGIVCSAARSRAVALHREAADPPAREAAPAAGPRDRARGLVIR